jgi:hypothetical protein
MSEGLYEHQENSFLVDCERVYRDWHERAKGRDTEGLLALYAEDAALESPLVSAILDDRSDGILRGHDDCAASLPRARDAGPMTSCVGTVLATGLAMVGVSWSGSIRAKRPMATKSISLK